MALSIVFDRDVSFRFVDSDFDELQLVSDQMRLE